MPERKFTKGQKGLSRRKRRDEHVGHDRWLISYADFITLLFAVFVVLYATSQVDQGRKMVQLGAAVQAAFRELGTFPGTDPNSKVYHEMAKGAAGSGVVVDVAHPDKNIGLSDGAPPDLRKLKKELQATLGEEIRNREVEVHMSSEGLVISLRETGFFPSGQARMFAASVPKLARIAKLLNEDGFGIRVEGHTDDVPIHNSMFKSNWELSTTRATEVLALLVTENHLDPKRLSVGGFAEYRPVASNLSPEGRQMNRRVDLVVVSHIPEKKEANGTEAEVSRPEDASIQGR
jgi:chemotaxis protein MotB